MGLMIQTVSLGYSYPHSTLIFKDFNWQVKRGEAWAVLGPSGCGKTTLLYLLSGLRLPTSGSIYVNGEAIQRPRPRTGLILQDFGLLPWATVRENAALGLEIRGFYGPDGTHAPVDLQPVDDLRSAVDHWLERLGLYHIADKYPGQISGGQRQRTAIARTLVTQPDLLLMDEPFSSLDAPTRESLQSLILELCDEQEITLIIVTHGIEEAAFVGKKILLLGEPPNYQPDVTQNPDAGMPEYRHSLGYVELCRTLRSRMDSK